MHTCHGRLVGFGNGVFRDMGLLHRFGPEISLFLSFKTYSRQARRTAKMASSVSPFRCVNGNVDMARIRYLGRYVRSNDDNMQPQND
jgi:hypothetical protein